MSTTASDGTPDGLSDWTDIVHNVAQYNPHLSLLSLNSSDELFKRPYKNFDNRRRTSTSSRNSTPDSSRSFKHPGSFVNCFNNRSSTSDLSINSSISCSPSKFYHTEQLIASYASSYGGSPSNSSSWIPRKRMRYADLSDSNTSNIVDENDFDMSGVCRFTSRVLEWTIIFIPGPHQLHLFLRRIHVFCINRKWPRSAPSNSQTSGQKTKRLFTT